MDPVFKNPTLKIIIKKGKNAKTDGTTRDIGFSMIGGYVYSLLEVAGWPEVKLDLDLTYATVKNLAPAIAWEFSAGMNPKSGYTAEQNVEIAEKTLASYLMCLALNEENAVITVKEAKDRSVETINSPSRWSGFDINVSRGIVTVNFLKEIIGSVTISGNKLTVRTDKAIKTYKTLTGNDLSGCGVEGLTGEFRP